MNERNMNIALVLSGGGGLRMHADIPKQYIRVKGKMLLAYSLETILKHPSIDVVYIIAGEKWKAVILDELREQGINGGKIAGFAAPGLTRQESVFSGLEKIREDKRKSPNGADHRDIVLIHDAARPGISPKQITDCFHALHKHEGVVPVLPMKDTVYVSTDGRKISALLNRTELFAGQAPEAFLFEAYYEANKRLLPDRIARISGSAEPAVMAGMEVVTIPGEEQNFKITTNEDLDRFKEMVNRKAYLSYGGQGFESMGSA